MDDLESKLAIHELLSNYCFFVDARDWKQLRPLFTDDAEWVTGYANAHGGDEVIRLLDRLVPAEGQGPRRMHFVANLVTTVRGDRATARSNYVIYRASEGGIIPSVVGTYHDELRREDGAWRFGKRNIVHHMTGDMGLSTTHEPPGNTA